MSSYIQKLVTTGRGSALYIIPAAFALGLFLKDQVESSITEDKVVQKRIAQRLGQWESPVLSSVERNNLEREKAHVVRELEKLGLPSKHV